eukprot:864177-Prorocentrum_minimum.AAC.1
MGGQISNHAEEAAGESAGGVRARGSGARLQTGTDVAPLRRQMATDGDERRVGRVAAVIGGGYVSAAMVVTVVASMVEHQVRHAGHPHVDDVSY